MEPEPIEGPSAPRAWSHGRDPDDATSLRRRQATVLIADIVGFTGLSGMPGAELVSSSRDDLWLALDAVVDAHGGHVDPHVADGLMAVWGIDGSHEGDPERAVRCALALQQALSEVAARSGRRLAMRIGVNTGPVVVTEVATTGQHTATGDTVEVAISLETAAPMGGIVVSHETYRHVRGVFDVAQLDPIRIGGKREALRTYAVLEAKPRAFRVPPRGIEGVETRTIGRDDELGILRGAVGQVLADRRSRLVTVVGEPGIGKSRVLYDLDNWIELHTEFMYYFKGRAFGHRRDEPYGLMRDLIADRCEILDSDPPAEVLTKIQDETSPALSGHEAAVLGRWLGFDLSGLPDLAGPTTVDAAGGAHLVAYLRSLGADSPLVWLLEDLHWADDASLDLLERLVTSLPDCGLLIVATARPELFDRRPRWGATSQQLRLGALSSAQSAELVNEILRPALFVPDELRQLIVSRAKGRPLHIEELVKTLVDHGVIDPGDGTWVISLDRLDPSRVPSTLPGVLRARLDALPAAALTRVQHAAVVGRVFWDAALAAMTDSDPGATRSGGGIDLVDALDRELVIHREPSSFEGTRELAFRHALVRDAAYETIPTGDRPHLHASTARWLERAAAHRRREYLGEVAQHFRMAGDPAAAATRLHELARARLESGDPRPARAVCEQAIALCHEAGTDVPAAMLTTLAQATTDLERRGDAEAGQPSS